MHEDDDISTDLITDVIKTFEGCRNCSTDVILVLLGMVCTHIHASGNRDAWIDYIQQHLVDALDEASAERRS